MILLFKIFFINYNAWAYNLIEKYEGGLFMKKSWTSSIKTTIKQNKMITATLGILIILISIDALLVNSFLQLISSM